MKYLISILELFYALVGEFRECVPESTHYIGNLPETYQTPSFLYLLVFNSDRKESRHVKNVLLDVQIIYFNHLDGYGIENFEDKIKTLEKLKVFLDSFCLKVQDRVLKFEYMLTESDGQLTIDIKFKFKDGVVQPKEVYDFMEHIKVNREEVV